MGEVRPRQEQRERVQRQQKGWCTSECFEVRGKERKCLKRLRQVPENEWERCRGEYLEARRHFRRVCEESKERWKKKMEREVKSIITEEDFWKFINQGRKKRNRGENTIVA